MNKERKELYYRSRKPSGKAKELLEDIQRFEDDIGIDVCLWDTDNIISFLKNQHCCFPNDIYNIHQYIMAFVDYCERKGDVSSGCISLLTIKDLIDCLDLEETKQYYMSREEFVNKIGIMINPVDRFFLLGIFEGLHIDNGKEEVVNVKLSDLDGNTLHLCTGRSIKVSDELINIMVASEQTFEYIGIRETHLQAKRDYVVKPTYRINSGISDRAFTRRIERVIENFAFKQNLERLTPNTISEIGRYNFIKDMIGKNKYTFDELFSWARNGRAFIHEEIYGQVAKRTLLKNFYMKMLSD